MKKVFSTIFYIVAIALVLWFVLSYIEVVTHNLEVGYIYSKWNYFAPALK